MVLPGCFQHRQPDHAKKLKENESWHYLSDVHRVKEEINAGRTGKQARPLLQHAITVTSQSFPTVPARTAGTMPVAQCLFRKAIRC